MDENKLLNVDYPGELAKDNPGSRNQMEVKDVKFANIPVEPALK